MLSRIPQNVFHQPVQGLRLNPGTLADQLDPQRPALLVFLRHFGCPFCKEAVNDLHRLTRKDPAYPPVLFFSQSCTEEAAEFFAKHWPDARVVCDPEKEFYFAMGLRQGTFGQVWGLRVWTCSFRALAKGHVMSKPIGDPWLMPGAFLVRGDEILWAHEYEHQGDNPAWDRIPRNAPATDASPRVAASAP